MQLVISGQALGEDRPLAQILKLLNELDVRWIDLWPANVEGGDQNRPGWTHRYEGRDVERAETELNAHGIGVACVSMPGAFSAELSADPADYLAALKATIDLAVRLRVRLVNCYAYHFALDREAPIDQLVDLLRSAAAYAERFRVTLLLENEAHDATATPAGMLRVLDAVESPALRTAFDPANYYQAGAEPFPDAYERLHDRIGYVHLKGAAIFDPDRHPEYARGGTLTGAHREGHVLYPPLPDAAFNAAQVLARAIRDRVSEFCMLEPHVPPTHAEDYYRVEVPYVRRHGVH